MNFLHLDRTWIVAEIGVNHEGDENVAIELIRLAAGCGVDAVKFQTYETEHYISTVQPERRERARKFQLSEKTFRLLAETALDCGVLFFSTPFHPKNVDFLDDIVPLFKISSGDLTYLNLIKYVARKGKPLIISTGLGTEEEIRAAVNAVLEVSPEAGEKGDLALMHCIAAYPAPHQELNLGNIQWLQETFGLPTGYSDHSLGIRACELAVAAGAVIIEKHFTYRKENQVFHDHAISADPEEMRQLVKILRAVEEYRGKKIRQRARSEEGMLLHLRRSIGTLVDIPAGKQVQAEWLTYLRPAWGLSPDDFEAVVGKRLRRTVPAGDLIRLEDIENP